jgi:AraC-like DNA-binding protein
LLIPRFHNNRVIRNLHKHIIAMVYKLFSPHYLLKPYVKCFWILEGVIIPGAENIEKVLPDGCMEMILHYGDAFKKMGAGGIVETQPYNFIIGQIKSYIQLAPTGNIGVIGVRFYPNGLSAFTNVPADELTGECVTLDNFFGRDNLHELQLKLPAANYKMKVGLIETLLLKKLAPHKYDFVIDSIVKKIRHHDGQVDLPTLLKDFKISERHFERQFKKAVGLNPKFFARLTRFNSIMQLMNSNGDTTSISLSYLGGYYDQAHFIKDFKEFSGENPGQYFSANHTLSSLFLRG